MNSLSALIWLSSIADDLDMVCGVVLFGATVIFVVFSFGLFVLDETDTHDELKIAFLQRWSRPCLPIAILAGALGIIVPSGDAIKLIAASELGEQVLTSKTVTKAEQALDKWLSYYLAGKKQ
jgi:hypothetical protein